MIGEPRRRRRRTTLTTLRVAAAARVVIATAGDERAREQCTKQRHNPSGSHAHHLANLL
jgi:hypothetical protein